MKRLYPIAVLGIWSLNSVSPTLGQTQTTPNIIVNSNSDEIAANNELTLREAIAIVNGNLALDQLSQAEQQLIKPWQGSVPVVGFQLTGDRKIELKQSLPDLAKPIAIDGTTQPGYNPDKVLITQNEAIRQPIVEITPSPGVAILRGLTITADQVTIRGLSLYGFTSRHGLTASTPPADIFIAHAAPPPDITQQRMPANKAPFADKDIPPKNILIEQNWLGIRPDLTMPETPSAFGISVFNSTGTTIRHNWIANHDGSGIITSVKAENTTIDRNVLIANGLAGMPDAIRLEGKVDKTTITGNYICGNDGSGIYLFKPAGSVSMVENTLLYNGRRLRRAAIYLSGHNHQVKTNQVSHQTAAGVVVAADPPSLGNQIQNNQFNDLEGISIDLNTHNNTDVSDWQRGDGLNPDRNSPNRRRDTGNGAVEAPKFTNQSNTRILPIDAGKVTITGKVDAGSVVEIYRVKDQSSDAGSLSESLITTADTQTGTFTLNLGQGLNPGDRISAIAHHPKYGTSEPAINAYIGARPTAAPPQNSAPPTCTTPPKPPTPPPTDPPPTEPIRLSVPKNVHFALDKDFISARSAKVLDRVAEVLLENPTIVIDLHGHTDPRASDAYNIDLGRRRALAVRNYLLRKGIDPSRMTLRTFGERQRLSNRSGKVDYARDRRTEIIYKDVRNIEVIVQEEDLQIEP
ncbi:MAG: OmpA family protein [Synechococcales bacterium]|nr:OmpA family protein [Synechococcales bacterium]